MHLIHVYSKLLVSTVAVLGLGACSTVNVKAKPDLAVREGVLSVDLLRGASGAEFSAFADTSAALLESARKLDRKGSKTEAAGCYLKAAVEARSLLVSGAEVPGSEAELALRNLHNQSLARFAELWVETSRKSGEVVSQLDGGAQRFEVRVARDSTYAADYFDRVLASASVEIKGVERQERNGVGAALVGIREQRPERAQEMEFYPPRGLHVATTLTVDHVRKGTDPDGPVEVVTLSLRNPATEQTVAVGSRTLPVAADFSAPIAVILAGRNEWTWGLSGFFDAEERLSMSGIVLAEPYDPERIPVLMIHGLVSVPIIWRDTIPAMFADPEVARRYQVLIFAYPSSFPIVESAQLLRKELEALRARYDPDGNDPLSTNMVVAGHSMGGILTRIMATELGDNFWKQFSDSPVDALPVSDEKRAEIRELVYFDPDPAVRRLVFYSVPHRGADMATGGLVGLVSRTVKLPGEVLEGTTIVSDKNVWQSLDLKVPLVKATTSVQSLQPGAPMLAALEISPFKKGVVYHSVIGDRGKGDSPESSDGVVEYWSSHLDGAASELIVPSGHSSFHDPAGIGEMIRILRLHVGLSAP